MKLEEFKPVHEYLVCVDSDGCAMDTMTIKHIRSFCPEMIREWNLEEWGDAIQDSWNHVNLYSMTRGINRFKGLVSALTEVNEKYRPVEGLDELVSWAENARALSNDALEEAIRETGSPILKKALKWSHAVNDSIGRIEESLKAPFEGVREALAETHSRADVAIVSSANPEAIEEEWNRIGIMDEIDVLCSQREGSKAACIAKLLEKGYAKDHVLMCGDAPGDLDAAKQNGVLYYPILVNHENESWTKFRKEALDQFLNGEYEGSYQEEQIRLFLENLNG